MGALDDISNLISSMNQRSDADDIANKVVSGDPSIADAPGAPIGSGITAAWAQQHGTTPLPSGLAALAGNKQATALNQIGQDAISGNIDPMTALQKVSAVTGGDPTKLIQTRSLLQAYGLLAPTAAPASASASGTQPTASATPPNPMAAQAPALAQMGSQNPQPSTGGLMPSAIGGLIIGGTQPADIMKLNSELSKNKAETDLANSGVKKNAWEMGDAPQQPVFSGSPSQQASQAFARIQQVENASGDPNAAGDGGLATGLGQTHPAAFAEGSAYAGLQNPDPKNPAHQMIAARGYFDKQLDANGGNIQKAIVGYNKPEVASNWDGNPSTLPPQQAQYLSKVLGQPIGQQLGGKAAQDVAMEQAKAKNTEVLAAEKGVQQILSRMPSMKAKLSQMNQLAPNTISGMGVVPSQDSNESFGLKGQLMEQFPKQLDPNDQIGATSTFKNLNDQLFVNEIPALMNGASGMRMDIPLVKGVKSASGVPLEIPGKDKQQVIATLNDNFDQTRNNALSYYKNLTGQDYDLGKAFQTPTDIKQAVDTGVIDKATGIQLLKKNHGFK